MTNAVPVVSTPHAVACALAGDILAGHSVMTILSGSGVDQLSLRDFIGSEFRKYGMRPFFIGGGRAEPRHLQETIADALGMPRSAMGPDVALQPGKILQVLATSDDGRRIALLIDHADEVSAVALCYLWLMIGLFDFGSTRLHVILLGGEGVWDGWEHANCAELRAAARAYRMLGPPETLNETARLPDGYETPVKRRRLPALVGMALPILGLCLLTPTMIGTTVDRSEEVFFSAAIVPDPEPVEPDQTVPLVPPVPPPSGAPPVSAPTAVASALDTASGLQDGMVQHSGHGLVLLAQAGDSLPALYAKVYRGLRPPPYAEVVEANGGQLAAGSLVIFPAPPGGWRAP